MDTQPVNIQVQVPLAVCCCFNCPTPPEPYIPGAVIIDNSQGKPVYIGSNLSLPVGWIKITVAGVDGVCCPFDQQTLDPILIIMPDNLLASAQDFIEKNPPQDPAPPDPPPSTPPIFTRSNTPLNEI